MVTDAMESPCRLQFFVRTDVPGCNLVLLRANASDTIESVHQQILLKTSLSVLEQRLIFGGRKLQHHQTLASCHVVNDATLKLVPAVRMPTTAQVPYCTCLGFLQPLPGLSFVIHELVITARRLTSHAEGAPQACRISQRRLKLKDSQNLVLALVLEFLKMASESTSTISKHMQVFRLAGATSALVDMFVKSKLKSNRDYAENAIIKILDLSAHNHLHHYHGRIPVILDFCKLLDPGCTLYTTCLDALARLLDTIDVTQCTGDPLLLRCLAIDCPAFVNLLSARLCLKFCRAFRNQSFEAKNSDVTINFKTCAKRAREFMPFGLLEAKVYSLLIISFENQGTGDVGANVGAKFPRVTVHVGAGVETGTRWWLDMSTQFRALLEEIDNCLKAVEHSPVASESDYLTKVSILLVLKGLHAIAQLSDDAMNEMLKVLGNRYAALNMLIQESRGKVDVSWLLAHKKLLDYKSRRKLAMARLPSLHENGPQGVRYEVLVRRSELLTESFESLAYVEPHHLQGGISVKFKTEEGTGPGVLREWFSIICREIFNCQNALFSPCSNDRRRFFPNPASSVNPGHLTYFWFCGRVIALALMHSVQVDVVFAVTFFKQLAGLPISWEDAKDADPVLYESCKKILEMDSETVDSDALGLTFVTEVEELGQRNTLELCQGGKEMVVNSRNRKEFVNLLVHRRLVGSVTDQIKSFAQGFSDLLLVSSHAQFFRPLEPEDLDLMLDGHGRNSSTCLDDWRTHTVYHGYVIGDPQITWFWQVVGTMTPEQRRRLLFFSTSLTHLPAAGFSGFSSKFHIYRGHTDTSWLPTAHTCFCELVLPPYPTYDIMHARLHLITEAHIAEGFGFV